MMHNTKSGRPQDDKVFEEIAWLKGAVCLRFYGEDQEAMKKFSKP